MSRNRSRIETVDLQIDVERAEGPVAVHRVDDMDRRPGKLIETSHEEVLRECARQYGNDDERPEPASLVRAPSLALAVSVTGDSAACLELARDVRPKAVSSSCRHTETDTDT
jgi:hypothetical protein